MNHNEIEMVWFDVWCKWILTSVARTCNTHKVVMGKKKSNGKKVMNNYKYTKGGPCFEKWWVTVSSFT